MMWDIATVISKLFILMAMAIGVGGIGCFVLFKSAQINNCSWLLKYLWVGSLVGVIFTCAFFLIQIGAINQTGLSGIIDVQMGAILAQSGLGDATVLRLCGFILILTCTLYAFIKSQVSEKNINIAAPSYGLIGLGVLLLAYSFSLTGHTASKPLLIGVAINSHVVVMAFWVGSLYPLWKICSVETTEKVIVIMHQFGKVAMVFVTILILTGLYLITKLLESLGELVSTPYGKFLTLKLIGVIILLLLAARNKFKLVPLLKNDGFIKKLKRSILVEMMVVIILLLLTSYFTSLVGLGHI